MIIFRNVYIYSLLTNLTVYIYTAEDWPVIPHYVVMDCVVEVCMLQL